VARGVEEVKDILAEKASHGEIFCKKDYACLAVQGMKKLIWN
jgi:hypothetical protein